MPTFDSHQELATRADVRTDDPGRYAKQLISHLGRKLAFQTEGNVSTAPIHGGVGQIVQGDCVLTLVARAPDADTLERVQAVLGGHLLRFGQRSGLTVTWTPAQNARRATSQTVPRHDGPTAERY